MMRKYLLVLLVLLTAFSSCKEKDRRPGVFIEEPQMIDLLADTYLIEAELNKMKSSGKDVTALQQTYYDQLFEHYGITDTIFEQNMAYYTHHPSQLERMMDSVVNRFVRYQQ